MDKEKLIKGAIWFSGFSICIIFSAMFLFIGFNNQRHGNYTLLIIGMLFIPLVFYCAFRGLRLVIESIFD